MGGTEPDPPRDFEGRVAVLTGAGGGIGRAIAVELSGRGASVAGHDRDPEALAETARLVTDAGGCFVQRVGDVTDRDECHELVAQAVDELGAIDVFGSIAGVAGAQHFHQLDPDTWHRMMAVNTDGVLWCAQAALPQLIARDGVLINLASNAGLMGQAYNVAYTASKAAVVAITRSLAMEYAKATVRINAIAPAGVDTPMTRNFELVDEGDWSLIAPYAGYRGMSRPEDIAAIFAFVASPRAVAMHGAIVPADLGSTAG